MYFRVRFHVRRSKGHPEIDDRGEPIPAGMFTTRYASGRDEAAALKRAIGAIESEITGQGVWSAFSVEVEAVERASMVDYVLNHRKGGGSWYLRE